MTNHNSTYSALTLYEDQPTEGVLVVKIFINDEETISLNSKEPPGKFRLLSVWVRKEVNKIGKAEVNLKAWSETEAEEESDSDSDYFTPGHTIRIESGYLQTTTPVSVFEGIIIAQQLEVDEQSDTILKIECRDLLYPATMVPKTRIHKDTDDKKLVESIVKDAGNLRVIPGDMDSRKKDISQYRISDWDLLLQRAQANNLCVITEGKDVTIDKPALSKKLTFIFRFRENIVSIKGKLQASQQLAKVQVLAWNSKQQKLMSVVVDKTDENDQGAISPSVMAKNMGNHELILQTSDYNDDQTIKKWAEAKLQESSLRKTQGDVTCQGTAAIKAGCMVEIVNVGKHFDGEAYCGAVEHDIKDGNWLTTVIMGYPDSPEGDNQNEISSEPVPVIKGLQIGKVLQIHQDPSKEFNILVELPAFKEKQPNKVWARFSTLWASAQYGAYFFPDIQDEVVLGFFDNDPNKPVILGSLYSSKQQPAYSPEQENNFRGIVTRSKMKLEFEEEKKCITIETPGKNVIEVSDDGKSIKLRDQNQNKIEMTSNGVSIESAQSVRIKAKTDITIEAGTSIDIKGKTAVNVKAMNIEAKADVTFTAKGGAKSEVSAGGQTVIKGAMVMIN